MKRALLSCLAVFALVACEGQGVPESSAIDQRVALLVDSLSLEQKVAQMIQGEIKHVTPDDVREYGLGSVLNGGGSFPNGEKLASLDAWTALADDYYAASIDTSAGNAGIPIIWGTDAVHGHNNVIGATLFPHNIGLGAANDPALVGKIAAATAREVKATGIDWIFAPTIAVAQDPRWGRTYESFSSDTARVAQFAAPIVEGMQSEGMVATAKHFIGDGGTFRGIDQGDTRLSLEALLDIHGAGYYEALDAGVMSVMATFNSWNGDKIHGNHELLTKVLKERLAFEGFVVSDWNGIGQVNGCTNANCAQAINAGIDMIMAPEDWKELHGVILEQVRTGEITEARIDDAVTRILKVKANVGLLDRKPPSATAAAFKDSVGSPEHRSLARQAVRKSLVMLKNEQSLIPLQPTGTYLITGPAADDIGMQSGGWTISWQGTGNVKSDFPGGTSILDGLAEQIDAAGGRVLSAKDYPGSEKPDAVIYVFGETPYAEGVGDIETLAWQQRSQHDKKAIDYWRAQGIPVVSVFVTGRPRWTNAEINASNAFVVAWLPGSEGAGVADVLLKDANGSVQYDFVGRLPMAWPANDVNAIDPDRPVQEAAFPLGFGLAAV
jgi:beta-glucosidase